MVHIDIHLGNMYIKCTHIIKYYMLFDAVSDCDDHSRWIPAKMLFNVWNVNRGNYTSRLRAKFGPRKMLSTRKILDNIQFSNLFAEMMINYQSLVIIFIKRTDIATGDIFYDKSLGWTGQWRAARWRWRDCGTPHRQAREYWQSPNQNQNLWQTKSGLKPDILIKTFQLDTSKLCAKYF